MIALWTALALARPPAEDDAAGQAFQAAMLRLNAVIEGLNDCTFTFRSQEYVGGSTGPWSTAEVKFRVPDDIYLHFTDGPNTDRKLIYRGEDWNGGKFRIDPGPWVPTMNLHPEGRLARRGNRHTIKELPLTKLGAKVLGDAVKVRDHDTWTPEIEDLGPTSIGGASAHCYDSRVPKDEDPSLYAHRAVVCLDQVTGLPARIQIWDREDGEIRLVESYEYHNLKPNTGLTDADFDPATYDL